MLIMSSLFECHEVIRTKHKDIQYNRCYLQCWICHRLRCSLYLPQPQVVMILSIPQTRSLPVICKQMSCWWLVLPLPLVEKPTGKFGLLRRNKWFSLPRLPLNSSGLHFHASFIYSQMKPTVAPFNLKVIFHRANLFTPSEAKNKCQQCDWSAKNSPRKSL
jgi:hypothetical protein